MISDPDFYLDAFHDAGADVLTVHPEATHHLHRTLTRIRELGMKAGAALNPSTSLVAIEHVLAELDVAMIMTVNPGFGGQAFIPTMLPKIRTLRDMIDASGFEIMVEIDGGVSAENAAVLAQHGADVFVAGSAVFRNPPYRDIIATLRDAGRTFQERSRATS
jgi:ribulose-phosphate 3-epimerase